MKAISVLSASHFPADAAHRSGGRLAALYPGGICPVACAPLIDIQVRLQLLLLVCDPLQPHVP